MQKKTVTLELTRSEALDILLLIGDRELCHWADGMRNNLLSIHAKINKATNNQIPAPNK